MESSKRNQTVVMVLLFLLVPLHHGCNEPQPETTEAAAAAVAETNARIARLSSVEGPVVVVHQGSSISAQHDHELFLRDRVQTGTEGTAKLLYLEMARAEVGPETQLEVLSNGLRINRGETWFHVVKRDREFVVEAPGAVLAVLGTTFGVTVDRDGTTRVRVRKGAVEMRSRRENVRIEGGGRVTVDGYGHVTREGAVTPRDQYVPAIEGDRDSGLHIDGGGSMGGLGVAPASGRESP